MTDKPDLTKRQEQGLGALIAQKLAAGEDDAGILVIYGTGSPGIGHTAKVRFCERVSA